MDNPKVYVGVTATFDAEGRMFPREIAWEDDPVYAIDRIYDVRQAAALKAGSGGDRFEVSVKGKKTYLFFERYAEFYANPKSPNIGRWFVERK